MSVRPPRVVRWLLERALPFDVRDDITGDMEEMFRRRRDTHGPVHATAWYSKQALLFFAHFFAERLREERRAPVVMSWIDFKLAARMLVRYPGLTAVAVLGMAVGIAISAAAFAFGYRLLDPALPIAEGDRVVALLNWDLKRRDRESRVLNDFLSWRRGLTSIEHLGAFRSVQRNLLIAGEQPETLPVAEMSASGFAVTRAAPIVGRHLQLDDEQPGAADVVVIGEELWRRRFGGEASILGRTVQLGRATHTVVGVMPEAFAFPVNHRMWIPLRVPAVADPLSGPALTVFGRLAPGVDMPAAQSELDAIGRRATAASPKTHEHLRPKVVPYTHAFSDMDNPENALALRAVQTIVVLVLVLVSVNVAILVYARTATRQGEIAVRSALGASRRRIVTQLFVEALALAGLAAVLGTVLVRAGLSQFNAGFQQIAVGLPYWMTFTLTWEATAFIIGVTLLAATIVGVVPALKATGRRVQSRLQGLSAGSGSRMQMGRLWTFLIVAQVAVAVAVLPATVYHTWDALRFRTGDPGFASKEFLTAELSLDRMPTLVATEGDEQAMRSRFALRQTDLERRLESESAVAAVTFSLTPPGGEVAAVLEAEGVPAPADPVDYNIVSGSRRGHLVRFNRVGVDFFASYDVPLLAGRAFGSADASAAAGTVLVNRTFASHFFGDQNPLGRRIRYVGSSREAGEGNVELDRWYEVVGVVSDFPPRGLDGDVSEARVYHAAAPGSVHPALVALRVRTDPGAFAPRLRELAAAVDPTLQLRNTATYDDAVRREQGIMRLIGVTLAAVTLSAIALAAAGIYALMSFTVERRRREIGIRAALGADPARILAGIFSRVFAQLGAGALLGVLAAVGLESILEGEAFQGNGAVVLPVVALCSVAVGVGAALGPLRRGLRIQPIEALREE